MSGQALVPNINPTKQEKENKTPKDRRAVIDFFLEKDFDAGEAKKFFEHYAARNWKTSDNKEIRDWRAVAITWMARSEAYDLEKKPDRKRVSQITDNLRTTKNKDYGQPL